MEILANCLRKAPFRGIKINQHNEIKISQYADDLIAYIEGRNPDIRVIMQQLGEYSKFSGLKPNIAKSKCMWLGPPKPDLSEDLPILWVKELKVLGVSFTANPTDTVRLNYPSKIEDIRKLLNLWSMRNLSLIGKITVIKTLALSKIVHLLISIPSPNPEMLKEIKSLVFRFLWNNKPDKIRRTKICQPYERGGLKMIDIDGFINALKCTWIQRIQNNSDFGRKWIILAQTSLEYHLENLAWYGHAMLNRLSTQIQNDFWAQAIQSWARFTECYNTSPEDSINEIIWCNDVLNYKYTVKKRWRDKGILFIRDLMKNNRIYTREELERKYNIRLNFLEYASITIKMAPILRFYATRDINHELPQIPPRIRILLQEKNLTKFVYGVLLKNMNLKNATINTKIKRKWISEVQRHKTGTTEQIRKITHSTSMQTLHYKIMTRIVPTNTYLFKIGLSETRLCTFCNDSPETPGHLFMKCPKVQTFFSLIVDMLQREYNFCAHLQKINSLFPQKHERKIFQLINLIAIKCIWQARLDSKLPQLVHFVNALKSEYQIEKIASIMSETETNFEIKWEGLHSTSADA